MESQLRQGRADHDGGEVRGRRPRRVLRRGGRDPRRGPESLAAGDRFARDGLPVSHETRAVQAEKLRLFRAMRPLNPAEVVRGQFRGYRDEKAWPRIPTWNLRGAAAAHRYVAVGGCAFYIRTGKSLPISATEVIVNLKNRRSPFSTPMRPCHQFFSLSPESGSGHIRRRAGQAQRREHAGRARGTGGAPPLHP